MRGHDFAEAMIQDLPSLAGSKVQAGVGGSSASAAPLAGPVSTY